jgi:anaerobic ribonucleoside-triphosphate reductase activating protein
LQLFLSRTHFPITTLGFGRRIGVWFQGCSIRCPGCISADTWPAHLRETTTEALIETIEPWLDEADGLTVSGGEPFEQPAALEELLRLYRQRSRGDVLVFSGYSWEVLAPAFARYRALVDVLITDPFDATAGQTLALRGSDNQRMHLFSPLGELRYGALQHAARQSGAASLDVFIDDDGNAWFAGIPRLGDMHRLKKLLEVQGFKAAITQASDKR